MNGQLHGPEIQPCNADLPAGSHVACCNLTKSPPDICVGGGLCYSQDGQTIAELLVAQGCTDPTGKDVACQSYCASESLLSLRVVGVGGAVLRVVLGRQELTGDGRYRRTYI